MRCTSVSLSLSVSASDSVPALAAFAFALSLLSAPLDLAPDFLASGCPLTAVPLPFGIVAVAAGMVGVKLWVVWK